jgi:hypothetical protein
VHLQYEAWGVLDIRIDSVMLGTCPWTREYSGTMTSTIGPRPSDAQERETSRSAAEAVNSRLYLPVEYDRLQGLGTVVGAT